MNHQFKIFIILFLTTVCTSGFAMQTAVDTAQHSRGNFYAEKIEMHRKGMNNAMEEMASHFLTSMLPFITKSSTDRAIVLEELKNAQLSEDEQFKVLVSFSRILAGKFARRAAWEIGLGKNTKDELDQEIRNVFFVATYLMAKLDALAVDKFVAYLANERYEKNRAPEYAKAAWSLWNTYYGK